MFWADQRSDVLIEGEPVDDGGDGGDGDGAAGIHVCIPLVIIVVIITPSLPLPAALVASTLSILFLSLGALLLY